MQHHPSRVSTQGGRTTILSGTAPNENAVNMKPTLGKRLMFAGVLSDSPDLIHLFSLS